MANDNVCFSAKKGEIHAICGENGAGKSTLMKLLFGVEQPNQGRIIMRGQEVKLTSPMKAIEMGIGMVYQYFMLVSSLTVAENMMLGMLPYVATLVGLAIYSIRARQKEQKRLHLKG